MAHPTPLHPRQTKRPAAHADASAIPRVLPVTRPARCAAAAGAGVFDQVAETDPFLSIDLFRRHGACIPPHPHAGCAVATYLFPESTTSLRCRNAHQALLAPRATGSSELRRITVSAQRFGSVVSIDIDDTGPGMPAKARENLFSAFKGSARSGGTGLGLVIARELVLAHGGTIALAEKPGPGTLFRIEIPDRPVSLQDYRARA